MNRVRAAVKWLARTVAILLLVTVGSTILVRFAPGYLSDEREMDGRYAEAARSDISKEAARSQSLYKMFFSEFDGWLHGSGGLSRQYGVPVSELLLPRLTVTGALLGQSLLLAWVLAFSASLISSAGRNPWLIWQAPSIFLLAVPAAAMATICLVTNQGGPVLVMSLLLAARDFKFLHRILRKVWLDGPILQARAQGIPTWRVLWAHILPSIGPQLAALVPLSIMTALSAVVPVEVIFNVDGLGKLAWNAALNRDLPVLLAVTLVMALAVTVSGMTLARERATPGWNSV